MNLKSLVAVCVLALVMVEVMNGLQIEPNMPSMSCKCRRITTARIKKDMFKKIEIFPVRSYCPMVEVIITVKDNSQVCIDPKAKWFKGLLPKIYQMMKEKQKQENGQTTMETSDTNYNAFV